MSRENGDTPGSELGSPYHSTHKNGSAVDLFIVANQRRRNSIDNPAGEPKPTLRYTDTEKYNFECTCALMDAILTLRKRGYPTQFRGLIYVDANVLPEAQLVKWRAEQERKAKAAVEATTPWSVDDPHRVPAIRPPAMPVIPVIEEPPRELLLLIPSDVRLKAPSDHSDHIHVQLL